jgi:hypothetical protein
MTRRALLGLLLSAGLFAAGKAAAQSEYPFDPKESIRLANVRAGTLALRDDPAIPETITKGARWAVMRLTDPVNIGTKAGNATPMNKLVSDAAQLVLEVPAPPKRLSESQLEYIQSFGKAAIGHLRTVLGSKDKPSQFAGNTYLVVRVNAARILSALAKSGYEETADVAIEIIENPKESDAVRLYALQALRHLFAVPNAENPAASVVSKPERELKAVQALIAYIVRKPTLAQDASQEEVEALRYVRREAIRALGTVRKPVIRKEKAIVAEPALWLLKVASMDEAIPLAPGFAERMEAVIGYFQLNPDRAQNVDFAIYWTGAAVVEFAALAKNRPDPTPEPTPGKEVLPHESYGWRFGAARLATAMKEWKDAWESEHPNPPQPQGKMVAELTEKTRTYLIDPLINTSEKKEIETEPLRAWWAAQTWPNTTLYKENPKSIVTPIKRDQ